VLALVLTFGAGCGSAGTDASSSSPPALPWPAARMPDVASPTDNPTTKDKVELGRMLFHDPILSSDRKVACVTCHSQYWGMGDGLAYSIGVGGVGPAGVGRTGATHARRNARTLWNAAYRERLSWDGRASSLEEQVLVPLGDSIELGRAPDDIASDLGAIPAYAALFAAAFPGDIAPVRAQTITRALASFVRTIVSTSAPYDEYVRGDKGALSADEIRGMFLFADLGCPRCHTPPRFESELYADAGIRTAGTDDLGRYEVTGIDADRHAMRTPTLRNLRETGPYFHDGSVATIDLAVAWMVGAFGTRGATDEERRVLIAFLEKSLVDLGNEPERPRSVPSGLPVPLDGFTIPR
jgi:cytochrome c peroxidase